MNQLSRECHKNEQNDPSCSFAVTRGKAAGRMDADPRSSPCCQNCSAGTRGCQGRSRSGVRASLGRHPAQSQRTHRQNCSFSGWAMRNLASIFSFLFLLLLRSQNNVHQRANLAGDYLFFARKIRH